MASCRVDPSLERVRVGEMTFPLGAIPVEALEPRQGYAVLFEPADGDNEGDWEEWPDRYVFDIVITVDRLEALVRHLVGLLPGRIYPILDILGVDAFREVDPYVSYELVGLDRFTDTLRQYRDFFFEDGLVGFGAMSDDPFIYFFIDEHKIITLRCVMEDRERVEGVLRAFDLQEVEEPAGADAAIHEHRSVLASPTEDAQVLGFEEIVEELRETWQLLLNVDPESNVNDDGSELGITNWRLLARAEYAEDPLVRYLEVFVRAGCLREAEELGREACDRLFDADEREPERAAMIEVDRIGPEHFLRMLRESESPVTSPPPDAGVLHVRWAS
jgi:hypothetical protein